MRVISRTVYGTVYGEVLLKRKLQVIAAATLLATGTAEATTGKRADFSLGFSTHSRGARTALMLHAVYKPAGDPSSKPSPIRKVVVRAPAGTRFHTAAVAK